MEAVDESDEEEAYNLTVLFVDIDVMRLLRLCIPPRGPEDSALGGGVSADCIVLCSAGVSVRESVDTVDPRALLLLIVTPHAAFAVEGR